MTNEHTSLEKYTSHTLFSKWLQKGYERVDVGCVWEVSWKREQAVIFWPQVPLTIAAFLSHSAGLLNRGSLRATSPQSCKLILTLASYLQLELQLELQLAWNWLSAYLELQLTQTVCGTWLYNCLTSTSFLWVSHLHRIQPRPKVKVIFRYLWPDAPVSWLTAQFKVNILPI